MSTLQDRLDDRRRTEEYATTWRPKEHGTTLMGTLEAVEEAETEYGPTDVAHIRDDDGQLWGAWLFHTVLENEWAEADPEPGDRVGIAYLGERDGDTHSYHAYAVEVEQQDAPNGTDDDAAETNGRQNEPAGQSADGQQAEFVPDDELPFS